MKFNWGTGIAIFYSIFAIMIVFMVVKANQNKMDLVTEHYYEKELDFEKKQMKTINASKLSSGIKMQRINDELRIALPSEFEGNAWEAELFFYCPSDAKKDRKIVIKGDKSVYNYKLDNSFKGYYQIELDVRLNKESYFTSQVITF